MVRTAARPRIEPVDPADEAALDAWCALEAAARRADRPASAPPCRVELGAELRVPWPGERVTVWLARDRDAVVGAAALYLPTLDNLDNAFGELVVHPAHRGRGTGRALLEHLAAAARAAGRVRLIGEVHSPLDADGPGVAFMAARGGVPALAETRRRLALPPDDRALETLEAAARSAAGGYELVAWHGPTPGRWRADIAVLTGRMTLDTPLDDLHLDPERYDAERIRGRDAARAARGMSASVTAARHVATDRLVAFTDIVVRAGVPWHAAQADTLVAPEHRGHRLGTLVKLENLRRVRAAHPALTVVDTFNADSNPWMVTINEAMGFRPLDRWAEWELGL